jgi:GntR family transcriptional regulator
MPSPDLSKLRAALDPSSPTPLYHQVRLRLETWIENHLKPGEELPTEIELAAAFDVSRVTIRQAVGELLADGKLYRPKARSRLRRSNVRVHQQMTRLPGFFRDDVLAAGIDPEVVVLDASVVRDERVAELLHVHADADLARVERLHTGDGQPMAIQVSYLPLSLFPGLLQRDLSGSLFRIAADDYGLEITGARQRVFARECRPEEAKALQLPARAPALAVERVSYTANRVPVEFFRCCLRPDNYDFTVLLGDLAEGATHSETGAAPWGDEGEPTRSNDASLTR